MVEKVPLAREEKCNDTSDGKEHRWEVGVALKHRSWTCINKSFKKNTKYIPVTPMMAIMLWCASNAQVCDLRLIVAQLVKCVAEKETRKVPTFSSGVLSREVIGDKVTGAVANERKMV